ncbi:oligosaccharide flippase family protein [Myroides odoratus]|uniref:oligosaccharide flippase family protein n=1 Tax=Myroides odoratus TaxID=256 RepID=UPI0039B0140B
MSVGEKVFKASAWSSLTEVVAKVVSPLVFLVLTRILSPSDYGVVAVATTLLTFIYIVSDLGTAKYIIQLNKDGEERFKVYNVAFTTNFVIGLILFVIIFSFSDWIAYLFNEPKSTDVIKIMSLQIIFYTLSSVQNALKRKDLNFKFLFYTRLITIGTPAVISIPLAFLGGGVWAIVFGSVMGAFLNTIILWKFSDWKPRFYFEKGIFKDIFSNSIWNTIEEIFIWIPIFLDTYLIANYFSSKDLGLFTTSRTLYNTLKGFLLAPLLPVLYSAFSSFSGSIDYNRKVLFSHKIVFTLSAVSCAVGFVYSELMEKVLFNDEWVGISYILKWTFVLMGCTFFNEVVIQALRAKGYFKVIGVNTLICTLISLPFIYFSVHYGIIAYVLIRYGSLYLRFPYIFYEAKRKLGISVIDCLSGVKYELLVVFFLVIFSSIIDYFIDKFAYNIMYKTIMVVIMLAILLVKEKNLVLFLKDKFFKRVLKR